LVLKTLQMLDKTIDEKDAGLWEFRNLRQHHCYTYLFHWAGSTAALKIAKRLKDEQIAKMALRLKKG